MKTRMKKKELEVFKKLLIKLKQKVMDELKHITHDTLERSPREASGDLSSYSFHMADVASDAFEREFNLDIASSEQNILYEIDEALKKIETGEYGICILCERKISKQRLKVIPYAKYCIECQKNEEKRSRR